MYRRHSRGLASVILALALLTAACEEGDSGPAETGAPAATGDATGAEGSGESAGGTLTVWAMGAEGEQTARLSSPISREPRGSRSTSPRCHGTWRTTS